MFVGITSSIVGLIAVAISLLNGAIVGHALAVYLVVSLIAVIVIGHLVPPKPPEQQRAEDAEQMEALRLAAIRH